MAYLFWIIVFGLAGYLIGRGGKQTKKDVDAQLAKQNLDWYLYIKSFKKVLKEKTQKKVIDDILKDVKKQGLVDAGYDAEITSAYTELSEQQEAGPDTGYGAQIQGSESDYAAEPALAVQIQAKPKAEIQLDNASLLLYLGAFIFVASIGLFVAFGSFGGTLKTLIVLLLGISVYSAGVGLYKQTKKYTQVGTAFAAIGMAIVPFVGLAAYLYIFEQSNGALVWFATSIICLAVYAHALLTFKNALLNYIFIFTLLSLFEASVSIINAPIYYFGWALAFLGILLGFIATFKNINIDFKDSASNSGQLFIPIAVLASLAMIPSQGNIQMGVTLFLAAAYYALQAINSLGSVQQTYAIAAQILGVGAVLWSTYGISNDFKITAITALIVNSAQLLATVFASKTAVFWRNFASVLVGSSIIGAIIAIGTPVLTLMAAVLLLLVGFTLWLQQGRIEGYAIAMLSSLVVPVIIGQRLFENSVSPIAQSALLLAAFIFQWLVYAFCAIKKKSTEWRIVAQPLLVVSLAIVAAVSLLTSPYACLSVCAALALFTLALVRIDKDVNWAVVAGAVIVVPVGRSFINSTELLWCVLAALLFNIVVALKYRQEANRWIGSSLWFIVPIALGHSIMSIEWSASLYAYSYMLVSVGFIAARAIARGVWFVSGKVPMASYAKSASLSYVAGYGLAIMTSLGLSLFAEDSKVLTTALLGVTLVLVVLVAKYIEKEASLLSAAPVIAQLMLASALRPAADDAQQITVFVLASSGLAIASYFLANSLADKAKYVSLRLVSLALLCIAPMSVLYFGSVWAMPVTLLLASAVLYYHFEKASQIEHEAIGALFTVGVLWLMWQLGVREVQAFSHVVVALFVIYAVWRTKRGEKEAANYYILAVLVTATVPLVLQALSGVAGGLYGWWLLLEQIVFIIIGMFISSKLMIQWGLYVAVAAILYQLRGLGWAALAFLGVFVIALAAYQIQRINKN